MNERKSCSLSASHTCHNIEAIKSKTYLNTTLHFDENFVLGIQRTIYAFTGEYKGL